MVQGFSDENRFGFEEIAYLLLFGKLPNQTEYDAFREEIASMYALPKEFLNATIMSFPSRDLMNSLAKSVLTLYAFDENAEDTSIANVIAQSLRLSAQFPSLRVDAYHSFAFAHKTKLCHKISKKEYSIAQIFYICFVLLTLLPSMKQKF